MAKKKGFVFQLEGHTAQDMQKVLKAFAARNAQMYKCFSRLFAQVVVETPDGFGPPTMENFYAKKTSVLRDVRELYHEAIKLIPAVDEGEVEFDLDVPGDVQDERREKAMHIDPRLKAEALASAVVRMPFPGDVSDPETYMRMDYYTQMLPLINALMEAVAEDIGNFLGQ